MAGKVVNSRFVLSSKFLVSRQVVAPYTFCTNTIMVHKAKTTQNMKSKVKLFSAMFFIAIMGTNGCGQKDNHVQKKGLSQILQEVIQKEADKNNFSGSVMILENNNSILAKSVGFADYNQEIKNELSTKYNIASVGKLFTKTIIFQLISDGKLSLDDPVSKFYDSFNTPPYNKLTIDDLINHKAGLRDVYVSSGYIELVENNDPDFQNEVVKIISKEELLFTPGTDTEYSNSGYYLLGAIVSNVEEKSFEEVVTDRIFEPLEMNNSGFSRTGDFIKDHAKLYISKWWGLKIEENEVDLKGDRPSGAGGQYSTVGDLAKLYSSLVYDNVLLTDIYKGLLFGNSENQNWEDIQKSGKIVGYVGGDTRGWSAKIGFYFLEQNNYGVVIVSNFDNMAHELDLKMREYLMDSSEL